MENWLATGELLSRLVSELEIWKQTYLITSPISLACLSPGLEPATIRAYQRRGSNGSAGAGAGDIVGKAFLPTFNSGKVNRGNAPTSGWMATYQEFGVLQ